MFLTEHRDNIYVRGFRSFQFWQNVGACSCSGVRTSRRELPAVCTRVPFVPSEYFLGIHEVFKIFINSLKCLPV